jgi:hypothetical protein
MYELGQRGATKKSGRDQEEATECDCIKWKKKGVRKRIRRIVRVVGCQ